jgi:L-lactate dehydrogenase complex protein LldG
VEGALVSSAREEVLTRIRAATADAASEPPPAHAYRRTGTLDRAGRVALFCARMGDYRAVVRRVADAELGAAIGAAFAEHGAARIGIPAGIPAQWRPSGLELIDDANLTLAELDALDGVLTGCTLAIAETGTVVLTGGPREGRRALTLVPDLHVCVVEERTVVELVPEAIAALAGQERRPLTFISGPSATSDIELSRVEGVHGPRRLVVLVSAEPQA